MSGIRDALRSGKRTCRTCCYQSPSAGCQRHWRPFIAEALADIHSGCRSAPECEVRDLVRSSTILPEFAWNEPLPEAPDVIPDAYLEAARLALEIDSIEWHQIGDRPERTERRRARFAALGIRVLPIVCVKRLSHGIRRLALYSAGASSRRRGPLP